MILVVHIVGIDDVHRGGKIHGMNELNMGIAGEHLVMCDLLLKGIPVTLVSHGFPYDIIADTRYGMLKIQVKTTRKKKLPAPRRVNEIYFFNVKRAGKNAKKHYQEGDFDCYALVTMDTKKVFYLPFSEAKSDSICIRDRGSDYSGKRGGGRPSGKYLQDLTFENYLKTL